jgi:hypothetical protein
MYIYEYSNVRVTDSTVTSGVGLEFADGSDAALSLQNGQFTYWNLYTNNTVAPARANLTLQNSTVTGWNIDSYSSTISLTNSDVDYLDIYDNSTLTALGSTIHALYSYGHSSATITSTSIDWLYTYDSRAVTPLSRQATFKQNTWASTTTLHYSSGIR